MINPTTIMILTAFVAIAACDTPTTSTARPALKQDTNSLGTTPTPVGLSAPQAFLDTSIVVAVPDQPKTFSDHLKTAILGNWSVEKKTWGPCTLTFTDHPVKVPTNQLVRERFRVTGMGCFQTPFFGARDWAVYDHSLYIWDVHGAPLVSLNIQTQNEWRGQPTMSGEPVRITRLDWSSKPLHHPAN